MSGIKGDLVTWLSTPQVSDWIRAGHLIAVIAWMAGMLYLPRLFVYHADVPPGSDQSETFKVMERRLLRFIMNPAMIVAWILGILLTLTPGMVDWSSDLWAWAKSGMVVAMSALHGLLARWRHAFAEDCNKLPASFFRRVNELPTVLLIGIVIMAVVKPF